MDALPGSGLQTWHRSLAPIADQFVRAAAGDVDRAFWQRIYNPADAYGGDMITGWAARFYPHLRGEGTQDLPNPLLDLSIDEPRELTTGRMGYDGPGVRSDSVPATLSRVIVNVNDRVGGSNRQVALHGGLVGVAQDQDGALRPVAGWHLEPAGPRATMREQRSVKAPDGISLEGLAAVMESSLDAAVAKTRQCVITRRAAGTGAGDGRRPARTSAGMGCSGVRDRPERPRSADDAPPIE